MRFKTPVFYFLLLFGLAISASAKPLRIIAISDFHGALESQITNQGQEIGGAALLSAYVKILKEDGTPTIILDGGDMFQGTLVSNTAEGRPVIDFYNYLGVTAAAIGNHEFDYGPTGPTAVPKYPDEDPVGALKERIKQAHFPLLSANIVGESGMAPDWVKPSILVDVSGVKVGIIGFSTLDTPSSSNPKNLVGLHFIEPVEPVTKEAEKLRRLGADYVVLVAHAGGGCDNNSPAAWNDVSSCDDDELFKLIRALPRGTLDAAVGGHTHKGVSKNYLGVSILQPFSNSKFIGWVNLSEPGQLVPIKKGNSLMGKIVQPDPEVVALLKGDFDRVYELKNRPLGLTTTQGFARSYYEENALGNFFTDLLLHHVKDVDVTLLNNGGLRENLPAKELTFGDIFAITPFDNYLAKLTITGAQLQKIIEIGISRKHGGISWSNLSFSADRCKVLSAAVNGSEINYNQIYRVLVTDFLASGGSSFDTLGLRPDQITFLYDRPNLRDTLVDALKAHSRSLSPSDYFNPKAPRQMIKTVCTPN